MRSIPRISALAVTLAVSVVCGAQSCTTQAKLVASEREALTQAAMTVANAIKAGDAGEVPALSDASIAANFGPTGYLIRNTAEIISGDSLRVTQLYQLDAHGRQANDTSEADFTCSLSGAESETSFGISGLPQGLYAFAMVEASGPRPYLLAFLFKQQGNDWKLAGLYPHARAVGGHDGLWYWNAARTAMKESKPWLAWLDYGEADDLLRPANFVSSTHLDKLRSERSASAPAEVRNGLGVDTPYVLQAADGTKFSVTALTTEPSPDGKELMLILHFRADALSDPVASRARNVAAARALLAAHPELRSAVAGVTVFADIANALPFASPFTLGDLN